VGITIPTTSNNYNVNLHATLFLYFHPNKIKKDHVKQKVTLKSSYFQMCVLENNLIHCLSCGD